MTHGNIMAANDLLHNFYRGFFMFNKSLIEKQQMNRLIWMNHFKVHKLPIVIKYGGRLKKVLSP